jgi:hypothetical protein
VKWLREPPPPSSFGFEGRKAAQVLTSTFGIIGLVLLAALIGGSAFGAVVFIRRRKRLNSLFSDAGGMLRLDIDPLPGTGTLDSRLLRSADDQ